MLTNLSGPERLAELDLSVDTILLALQRADIVTRSGSPLDPPIMEGLTRWGLTTRYLREALIGAGWSYDNPRNLARTIHPTGEFAIVVTTGDDCTGLPHQNPGPKHPKGYATELAVLGNGQLALDLGPLLPTVVAGRAVTPHPPGPGFCCSTPTRTCSVPKVSLPERFTEGRITRWRERILLPDMPRAPSAADDTPKDPVGMVALVGHDARQRYPPDLPAP
jgi:hypothetical protein